jgi:hypothetical protein
LPSACRAISPISPVHLSESMTQHPRGTTKPEFCVAPQKSKGAGNAGCLSRTHSLMCEWRKHMSLSHYRQAETSTFPAQWCDGLLRALPGVHDLLVTVALRNVSQGLTPAQGRQDHTPLPYAKQRSSARTSRLRCLATIALRPTCRDDRDTSLVPRRDAGEITPTSVKRKKYIIRKNGNFA